MSSHSLYAETLSELGTFGAVAVVALILAYWTNWRDGKRWIAAVCDDPDAQFCYLTLVATSVTVLQLMLLGLAGHNIFRYTWLWYAAFSAFAWRFLREAVAAEGAFALVEPYQPPRRNSAIQPSFRASQ